MYQVPYPLPPTATLGSTMKGSPKSLTTTAEVQTTKGLPRGANSNHRGSATTGSPVVLSSLLHVPFHFSYACPLGSTTKGSPKALKLAAKDRTVKGLPLAAYSNPRGSATTSSPSVSSSLPLRPLAAISPPTRSHP